MRSDGREISLALALQGGGTHGAFTWGVLDRLLEDETVVIESLGGASAGAVNAVALVAGWLEGGRSGARAALATLWSRIADAALPEPLRTAEHVGWLPGWMIGWPGQEAAIEGLARLVGPRQWNPFDHNPLQEILADLVDFERLNRASKPQVVVAATNLRRGRPQYFRSGRLSAEAVLASACLPFLNRPVELEGERFWDGGLTANPPLWPVIERSPAEDLVLVRIVPLIGDPEPVTADAIRRRLVQIALNAPLSAELAALRMSARMAREGYALGSPLRRRLKRLRVHVIDGSNAITSGGGSNSLLPQRSVLVRLHGLGRDAAEDWLARRGRSERDGPRGARIATRRASA